MINTNIGTVATPVGFETNARQSSPSFHPKNQHSFAIFSVELNIEELGDFFLKPSVFCCGSDLA